MTNKPVTQTKENRNPNNPKPISTQKIRSKTNQMKPNISKLPHLHQANSSELSSRLVPGHKRWSRHFGRSCHEWMMRNDMEWPYLLACWGRLKKHISKKLWGQVLAMQIGCFAAIFLYVAGTTAAHVSSFYLSPITVCLGTLFCLRSWSTQCCLKKLQTSCDRIARNMELDISTPYKHIFAHWW